MTTPTHIAKLPRDIAHCVSAYLQAGDLEGIASMFHPDCVIYFPKDQPPAKGKEGAKQVFAPFLAVKPQIKSEVISEVIIGNIALLQASWQVVDAEGNVLDQGQSTEIAKRLDNGGWGYLLDCPHGSPELRGVQSIQSQT